MTDFINQKLAERAQTFSGEEVLDFVKSNYEAIRYLMATKEVYSLTSNTSGEIDDWECDLESILFA